MTKEFNFLYPKIAFESDLFDLENQLKNIFQDKMGKICVIDHHIYYPLEKNTKTNSWRIAKREVGYSDDTEYTLVDKDNIWLNNALSSENGDSDCRDKIKKGTYKLFSIICPYTDKVIRTKTQEFPNYWQLFKEYRKTITGINEDGLTKKVKITYVKIGELDLPTDPEKWINSYLRDNNYFSSVYSKEVQNVLRLEWSQRQLNETLMSGYTLLKDECIEVDVRYESQKQEYSKKISLNLINNSRTIKLDGKSVNIFSPYVDNFKEKLEDIEKLSEQDYFRKHVAPLANESNEKILTEIQSIMNRNTNSFAKIEEIKKLLPY